MALLPKPYPDELIGSVIARYVRRTGLPMKVLLNDMFGKGRSNSSFLLGSGFRRLEVMMGTDAEELLLEHTVFPYATAFMPRAVRLRLKDKAMSESLQDESLSSITKNVSHGVAFRRVCRDCMREDLSTYGESYWHRQHHLPGAAFCLRHDKPLYVTQIALKGNAQNIGGAVPEVVDAKPGKLLLPIERVRSLADLSVKALDWHSNAEAQPLEAFREKSAELGYRLKSGDIGGVAVSKAFVDFYGQQFLVEAGCEVTHSRPWPALMMRPNGDVPFATIKYVLMQNFFEAAKPAAQGASLGYAKPGKKSRDYGQLDAVVAKRLAKVLGKGDASKTVTLKGLLSGLGFWQIYRHKRDLLPKVVEVIDAWRTGSSDLDSRVQLGSSGAEDGNSDLAVAGATNFGWAT